MFISERLRLYTQGKGDDLTQVNQGGTDTQWWETHKDKKGLWNERRVRHHNKTGNRKYWYKNT